MGIIFHYRPRDSIAAALLWLVMVCSPASFAETTVKLIAHDSVVLESLNISTLRAIFSLRKRSWENQTPIRVFVLPDNHPLHKHFCKTVLKIYPYVLREQWDRVIFSGVGTPPTIVKDIDELHRIVKTTPGAIGYAPSNMSTYIQHPHVSASNGTPP